MSMEEISLNVLTFIENAQTEMNHAEECRREKTRLQSEIRQLEKAGASLDKAISDTISASLKRKKEEVAAEFDEKLSICQNKIKDCKAERAKARADAVAEKIQKENSPLEHENTELEQQIAQIYEDNHVKSVFKKHGLVVLFFPKRLQDWLFVAAAAVITLFFVPLLLATGMGKAPVGFAFTLFIYLVCIFGGYIYTLHRFMLEHRQLHLQVEELKARVKENTKKINNVSANIRKSQDETGYNLGVYDDQITQIENQIKEILNSRKAALDYFEETTRNQIAQEIIDVNADQKTRLAEQLEERKEQLTEKTRELDEIEEVLRDTYEARLTKDLMHRQKLIAFQNFCQENPELPLEQAVDCYKTAKM